VQGKLEREAARERDQQEAIERFRRAIEEIERGHVVTRGDGMT
jgi:hypothetical protein